MKQFALIALILGFTIDLAAQKTYIDSVSYSLGVMVAQNFKSTDIPKINQLEFARAFNKVVQEEELSISPAQANQIINDFFMQQEEKKFSNNKKAGEEFLQQNAQREEVTVTKSGLQYEVLEKGQGPRPTIDDKVNVHYHGTLIDGSVFDSSVERGDPISFKLRGVIKGWQEGLQLMPLGSKYKLYIPQDLAYGPNSPNPVIKPFSTLVFEVQLLDIE